MPRHLDNVPQRCFVRNRPGGRPFNVLSGSRAYVKRTSQQFNECAKYAGGIRGVRGRPVLGGFTASR
jgi:hypothetical protein